VVELKDRLPKVEHAPAPETGAAPSAMRDDVLSALMNLGYHRPLAEKAVDAALRSPAGGFEQTLRQALRELAR
jgi:Holliday junction DNA helicase RuvA